MSSTRTADPDSPFRQERFASSPAYEAGLLGNLVAKRCKAIRKPEDRALIYWLQAQSHLDGGLESFVESFLDAYSERIGTEAMHKIGKERGQSYTAEETRAVYKSGIQFEGVSCWLADQYPFDVDGFASEIIFSAADFIDSQVQRRDDQEGPDLQPEGTVEEALRICGGLAKNLPEHIRLMCLDPHVILQTFEDERIDPPAYPQKRASLFWFRDLVGALHDYRRNRATTSGRSIAETSISAQIFEDLDYALHVKGLVLIEGEQRTGKSKSAETWAAIHPGMAVYSG